MDTKQTDFNLSPEAQALFDRNVRLGQTYEESYIGKLVDCAIDTAIKWARENCSHPQAEALIDLFQKTYILGRAEEKLICNGQLNEGMAIQIPDLAAGTIDLIAALGGNFFECNRGVRYDE